MSRYNLSRSRKFVIVQDFNCVQMRVSGYNCHYGFVLGAGAKAKTVTSLLPQPSVLAAVNIVDETNISWHANTKACEEEGAAGLGLVPIGLGNSHGARQVWRSLCQSR